MRVAFGVVRLLAACIGVVALFARLQYSMGFAGSAVWNYFSYFTTQSAMAATLLWAVGGVVALRRARDPAWLGTARMFITTYQIASGVVFGTIVAGAVASDYRLVVPLSDQVLHYWMPAYAVLDWLLAPGRERVAWKWVGTILAYPLIWGGFTMLRGQAVGWYPYFFLDPEQVGDVLGIAAYGLAMIAFMTTVATILVVFSMFLPPSRTDSRATAAAPVAAGAGAVAAGTEAERAAVEKRAVRSREMDADFPVHAVRNPRQEALTSVAHDQPR